MTKYLTSTWAAVIVLALFYGGLVLSLREKSETVDEPGHAAAGYAYWKFNDYRFDPENGNLSKRWMALPLLITDQQFPPATTAAWREANTWRLADAWFNRMGNDPEKLLFRGRAMAGLVAVALGAAVWLWSRRLFGPWGGMLSLAVYVLNPTILANGGLMTSDTPATLGFLVALGCIWKTLHNISAGWMLATLIAISGLFLAKMSAVLLIPIALILIIVRIADGRPLPVGSKILRRRIHQATAITLVFLFQMVGVAAAVWAAYGFRYDAFSPTSSVPPHFFKPWEWALGIPPPPELLKKLDLTPAQKTEAGALEGSSSAPADWTYTMIATLDRFRSQLSSEQLAQLDNLLNAPPSHWIPRLIDRARKSRILPEAFLYGYAHVWKNSDRSVAFFNGEIRETGWPGFFPFTFAVKTPLALFGLIGLAAFTAIRFKRGKPESRWRALWDFFYPLLPLAVLFALYWALAVTSHLNIGHRHLLPIHPPLFIFCGIAALWITELQETTAVARATRLRFRVAVGVLVTVLAVETAFWFPNYLAYFNGVVEPRNAYRHLVDSSLDWGQELPAIARYLKERPTEPAYLAYFGVGSPRHYGIKARLIGGVPGGDGRLFPPLKIMPGASETDVSTVLREHSEYDPNLVFTMRDENRAPAGAIMLQRSSALRLTPGVYVLSASMLQPLYQGKATGDWDETQEKNYRALEATVRPFFSEDRALKLQAIRARSLTSWLTTFDDFYDFRLARLTAYLRTREPDSNINYSVLVYRLTEQDVAHALDGPLF